jgi:transposase
MRGTDQRSGALFSYVDLEQRVPAAHPLRTIRSIVNDVLGSLDSAFDRLYEGTGRQSIAPERLLRASLLQAFYSIRSERQLMEQIDYNLLFRWSSGSASMTRCGTIPPSPRTATGCWMRMWQPRFSRLFCATRR